jgi:iodotyrosine deiodinase
MDYYELLETRRSVRRFSPRPVDKALLDKVLAAADMAPSGADRKPWSYIVLDDPLTKKKVRDACEKVEVEWYKDQPAWLRQWANKKGLVPDDKSFITTAPVTLVVTGNAGMPFWFESTWVSVTMVVLAAFREGLGTLTYTPGDTSALKEPLGVPDNHEIVVLLPIGYPNDEGMAPSKRTMPTGPGPRIFRNRFGLDY